MTNRPLNEEVIVVREASPGDAGSLALLAERTFRATFETHNTPEDMDAYCAASYGPSLQAAEIADPSVETLVAEAGESLVGYGQLCWEPAPRCVPGAKPAEVRRLYVETSWHGRGVAQQLFLELSSRADGNAADVVWLGVWEHNQRAIAFYEKAGFSAVGDQVFRLGADLQRDLVLIRRCHD